jgi:dolichyl-phosphate beta-glucosyltransferase
MTQYICKLIVFPQNSGKGAAVQAGMMESTGDYCLMVDADGATEFAPGLEALTKQLVEVSYHRRPALVLGSRSHLHESAARKPIRSFLMRAFRICVIVLVGMPPSIRDTQCGFKLLERSVAHHLFATIHLRRWAFDTELLFLAHRNAYEIREVIVPWHEVPGSKLHTSAWNLLLVSISMFRDMLCVRCCYTLGIWKTRHKTQ